MIAIAACLPLRSDLTNNPLERQRAHGVISDAARVPGFNALGRST